MHTPPFRRNPRLSFLSLALIIGISPMTQAQVRENAPADHTAPPDTTPFAPAGIRTSTPDSTEATTLDTIRVRGQTERESVTGPVEGFRARRAYTATKSDTPLAETPQSITVITADQITETGMTSLQDALGYAAGVRSDAYGLDSRTDSVRVRGSSVDTYRDGLRDTYNWYTSTTRPDPYTLERIEVLRGPASMLFGAGSVGGVLNLITKRPQFESHREVGLQLGSHGRRQLQFDLTGPVSEQFAWRLVGVMRKSDTQVDHVPDDRALLLPALTWKPDAGTTVTLHALYQKDDSGSTSQFFPWAGTLLPAAPGTLPTNRFIGEPGDFYDSERKQIGWNIEHLVDANWTLRQNYRYSRNLTDAGYHYGDFWTELGGWGADPVNQRMLGRVYWSQRVSNRMHLIDTHVQGRMQTGAIHHTLTAGIDYIRQHENVDSLESNSTIDAWAPAYGQWTRPTARTPDPATGQRQLGVYVQDQLRWQNWLLVAGLRHDRATGSVAGRIDGKDNATTRRIGLMYTMENGWNPYVSHAESFKPIAPERGNTYKPLRGELVELGVKYEPAGANLSFNAAAYRLEEKNQLKYVTPELSTQVDRTKTRGLELEVKGSVNRHLELLAHYNHTDADEALEGLPKNTASFWGTWRVEGVRNHGFSVGAGTRFMSSFHDDTGPRIPSSTLLDAMLAYDARHWRLALNINNLTDRTYFSTCLSRGDCLWGARRNVLLTGTYRFMTRSQASAAPFGLEADCGETRRASSSSSRWPDTSLPTWQVPAY